MKIETRTAGLLALSLLVACSTTGGDSSMEGTPRMARLYALGEAPPLDNVEIRFVRKFPVQNLAVRYVDNPLERVGTLDTSLVKEVYAYDARPMSPSVLLHAGQGCDYVLVDSESRVIGAFRVREAC